MFPFTKVGPFDHTERKALLLAFLFCALFIVLLNVSTSVKRTRNRPLTILSTTPLTTPFEPSVPSFGDPLEKFRIAPENFSAVDFKNFSYGVYMISEGKPVNLTLNEGKMWDASGWFNLQDVYYKDITGDGRPEAIVRLLRLRCNGSCDGGADLFYIYTTRNGKLKNIWRYETGSYAYGCGLKSFTLGNKQMVMELFGRCASNVKDYPGPGKFMVEDSTFMLFEFDGQRFTTTTIEYIPEPARNVKNYEPEIRIY
jgi:hypothetical protein